MKPALQHLSHAQIGILLAATTGVLRKSYQKHHYWRAARIAEPFVGADISHMRELGLLKFHTNKRTVALTDAGRALAELAIRLSREIASALAERDARRFAPIVKSLSNRRLAA